MPKRLFTILWCCALILLILFFPNTALASASSAISSWLSVVLPSLLPFCIATSLLEECGAVALFARWLQPITTKIFGFSGAFSYAFLASCLSGYPMGAKITSEIYANGQLSQAEASKMINCTSTSGPMYLVGAVAIGMLGDASLAKYLLIPHYLSAALLAILVGRRFRKTCPQSAAALARPDLSQPISFGEALSHSVAKGLDSMLAVGGFMVIYAVFAQGLLCALQAILPAESESTRQLLSLGLGALEMTTGCIHSNILPLPQRILYLCGITSFGGFCIQSQTAALCAKSKLPIHGLFWHKTLQGLLCVLFAGILMLAMPIQNAGTPCRFPSASAYLPMSIFLAVCALFCLLLSRRKRRSRG